MNARPREGPYLSLSPHCALKRLEAPSLYDIGKDTLYQLDEEAFLFLASAPPLEERLRNSDTADLVTTCLEEGICTVTQKKRVRPVPDPPPLPSLRYLLVHITGLCNLRCRHCFLGEPVAAELGLKNLLSLAGQFADLQGLRLIVSGGEPLLHTRFGEINSRIGDFPFRTILLSNGTLIDGETARALNFHEVQVSIDGLEEHHDLIRGRGSFRRAIAGLGHLAEAGVDISVATMVHRANLDDFDRLRELLADYPVKSWSVDVPCLTGNLGENPSLAAPPDAAAARMSHSFGGGYYGSSGAYACGAHLAAVMADGSVCKCGHFAGRPDGHISEGLGAVWKRLRRFRLEELSCRCSHLESCRGGCRYRAELSSCLYGPDPIQCFQRGVPAGGDLADDHRRHAGKGKGGEYS